MLADALLEAGDPRGELLALQLKGTPTAADRKREKALLTAHAKAWLAPFGRALGADVVFRRGFPAEGLVKFRDQGDAERYGALPEWATFERLSWSPPKTGEHLRAAGFVGPAFRHLAVADGPYVPWLLESDTIFALRAVSGRVGSPATLRRLVESPHLPRLRTFHVTDDAVHVDWIEALADAGRLEELGVRSPYPPRLLPLLAAAERTSLRSFALGTALRFHRAGDGTLSCSSCSIRTGPTRSRPSSRRCPTARSRCVRRPHDPPTGPASTASCVGVARRRRWPAAPPSTST